MFVPVVDLCADNSSLLADLTAFVQDVGLTSSVLLRNIGANVDVDVLLSILAKDYMPPCMLSGLSVDEDEVVKKLMDSGLRVALFNHVSEAQDANEHKLLHDILKTFPAARVGFTSSIPITISDSDISALNALYADKNKEGTYSATEADFSSTINFDAALMTTAIKTLLDDCLHYRDVNTVYIDLHISCATVQNNELALYCYIQKRFTELMNVLYKEKCQSDFSQLKMYISASTSNPPVEVASSGSGSGSGERHVIDVENSAAMELLSKCAVCNRDSLYIIVEPYLYAPPSPVKGKEEEGEKIESPKYVYSPSSNMSLSGGEKTGRNGLFCDFFGLFISTIKTDREDCLYTTVVCDEQNSCLGLVYSNKSSVRQALSEKRGIYWSRSRGGFWRKGDTSGMYQSLLSVRLDCDGDALKYNVIQYGKPAAFCHLLTRTCWGEENGLKHLQTILEDRRENAPVGSYTKRLFDDPSLLQKKLLEEVQELVEAEDKDHIAAEAADVTYFMMTRCVAAGVTISDIEKHLDKRSLKISRRPGNAKEYRTENANAILGTNINPSV